MENGFFPVPNGLALVAVAVGVEVVMVEAPRLVCRQVDVDTFNGSRNHHWNGMVIY